MAAGITTDRIKELFGDHPVIRIMPNLAVSAGEGMILYTVTSDVKKDELDGFLSLMKASGKFIKLDESLFDAGTSVSGCGPAFVCQFIEAMTAGGVNCGLSAEDSRLLAEQTLLGTAKMLLETGRDPADLRVAVCSPGGSTIEGVKSLQSDNIEKTISDAVNASYKRNIELGKK
jgi:pyrroline-5-carboxylate reductase